MSMINVPDPDWPRLGEKLFTDRERDWQNNVCLHLEPIAWYGYVEGYRRGAHTLLERVVEHQQDHDTLVHPIVFLYRQYLELRMKEIILLGRELRSDQHGVPHIHRLPELWRECRSIIVSVWPEGPAALLRVVEERINELAQVDPESMAFRYPSAKDGKPSLPPAFVRFNVRHFAERVEEVGDLLDGCAAGLSHYVAMAGARNG